MSVRTGDSDSRFRQLQTWGFGETTHLEPVTTSLLAISKATSKGQFLEMEATISSTSLTRVVLREQKKRKFRIHFILLYVIMLHVDYKTV